MNKYRKITYVLLLVVLLSSSGCSLLQIPLTLLNTTFSVVKQLLNIASKLPKPPPGVIPGL